jgi:hypothetical protein
MNTSARKKSVNSTRQARVAPSPACRRRGTLAVDLVTALRRDDQSPVHSSSEDSMKSHRWMKLCLGAGFVFVLAVLARGVLDAQEKKPRADADNPFAGKVVMVYEKNDPSKAGVGFVFRNAGFTLIKGVPFLVGKCIDERDDALAGFSASVPLDNIGSIVEFDDAEAYKKFAAKLSHVPGE